MRQLSILFLLFVSFTLAGQEKEFDLYLMVKVKKLSMRSAPDIKSKRLGTVAKDQLVKIIDLRSADYFRITVDNIVGTWVEVEYNGIIGFMFNGYLSSEVVKMPNDNWQGKYLLLVEGNQNGTVFSPDLNWYGIYPRKDGEYIELVNVSLSYSPGDMGDDLKISVDKKEKARMIVGTLEPMKMGRAGIPLGRFSNRVIMNGEMLPIPIYQNHSSISTDYVLSASEWKNQKSNCIVVNYFLSFCQESLNQRLNCLHTFEEVVENTGECNIPTLFWFGDLNDDNIPDFIFYNTFKHAAKYKLYLSIQEGNEIRFEKVIDFMPSFSGC